MTRGKKDFINLLAGIVEKIGVIIFTLMIFVIIAEVIFRFLLKNPLFWSGELARYLHIWVVFLGAFVAAQEDKHIKVGYLLEKMSPLLKKWVWKGILLVICCTLAVVCYGVTILLKILWFSKSPVIGLPIPLVYVSLLLGMFLMLVFYGQELFSRKDSTGRRG